MSLKYDEKTIEFMKSWGIETTEINDKRLKDVQLGYLMEISIGCDTNIRRPIGLEGKRCKKAHEDYQVGMYATRCKICSNALDKLDVVNVYDLERESITYVVRKSDFIFERMISHDLAKAEKGLTERQALEKRTEIEKERENRTVVEIQHNLEYGMWKIIGFESTISVDEYKRVFESAKNEMYEAFRESNKGNTELLSSVTQPRKHKHFDLLTNNFAYKIVDEVFEE